VNNITTVISNKGEIMNISKIQRLSEQYAELKVFHTACNNDYVELSIGKQQYGFGTILGFNATKLIVIKLRHTLLEAMKMLEKEIKKETAE
jgi:hypothetical protein